jgi:hypothetical protein
MILSGLLSTMNVYADSLSDIRLSLNDAYMILLMTGWMFFFMGIYHGNNNNIYFGLALVLINLYCIRTQFMIDEKQYLNGMIPHHSMAVFMSKKLLTKKNSLGDFLNNIVSTQQNEIAYMKIKN